MGNSSSANFRQEEEDPWWTNGHNTRERSTSSFSSSSSSSSLNNSNINFFQSDVLQDQDRLEHRKQLTENLNEFRQELARKHEKRRLLIAEKRKEMNELREELDMQKLENASLKKQLEENSRKQLEEYTRKFLEEISLEENMSSEERTQNLAENKPQTPEISYLEQKLKDEKIANLEKENETLKDHCEEMRAELIRSVEIMDKNKELRISIAEMQLQLQTLNSEVSQFEDERSDYKKHVVALKDVIKVSKDLLKIRENQISELTNKISEIEKLFKEREAELLSDNLKQEYEKQLESIRHLRTLYEERQRADRREKDALKIQAEEAKGKLEDEQKNSAELQERISELEEENSKKYDSITGLESKLGLSKAETRELRAEMAVINQLFSKILLSFNNNCQEVDLDNLTKILEENHDLLTEIVVNEESNEVSSALPKTLLDLVNRVNNNNQTKLELDDEVFLDKSEVEQNIDVVKAEIQQEVEETTTEGDSTIKTEKTLKLEAIPEESESHTSSATQLNSAQEIVENLPKVWRVLIELLSHQCPPTNVLLGDVKDADNPCYKSIQTPTGTKLVVSVSNTFIRLKDLILEKKSLEKETFRLKHLNSHLENRLQDQEKRLSMVSSELSKTWHVVGKMQKQHQQLHTQEKILRYELAQKRKLLTELKEELEYCREKWVQAREKNSTTETQWKQLRTEFASRKNTVDNSVESGYSDEKSSSDSDDHDDVDEDKLDEEDTPQDKGNNNGVILEVVKTEIAKIEGILQDGHEVQIATSSDLKEEVENEHSVLESDKTDLVQRSEEERHFVEISSEAVGDSFNLEERQSSKEDNIEKSSSEETDQSTSKQDQQNSSKPHRTPEEILLAREERLKRLETECQQLVTKVTNTACRSVKIYNKLESLHETYGEPSNSSSSSETNDKSTENSISENSTKDEENVDETSPSDNQ